MKKFLLCILPILVVAIFAGGLFAGCSADEKKPESETPTEETGTQTPQVPTYTVTFYDEAGETVLGTATVNEGGTATFPHGTPLKESTAEFSYTFDKWLTAPSGSEEAVLSNISSNINVYASFVSATRSYVVSFVPNNAAYGSVSLSQLTVPYGTEIAVSENQITIGGQTVVATATADTQDEKYSFVSWQGVVDSVLQDIEIVANFKRIGFISVTLHRKNPLGLAVPDTTVDRYENKTGDGIAYFPPTSNDMRCDGYKFIGWCVDESCETFFENNSLLNEDVELWALWAPEYQITYELNGADCQVSTPTSYTTHDENIELPALSWGSNEFVGWFADEELTESIETIDTATAANITVYAKWLKKDAEGYVLLSTADDFDLVRENLSKNFKLTSNIDLKNAEWSPIGTDSEPFTGTFDGNGYTISNLKVSNVRIAGLFGYTQGATFKNVSINNVSISNTTESGVEMRQLGALVANMDGGSAEKCSATNVVVSVGKISDSYSKPSIYMGGLIGRVVGENDQKVNISKCYTTGSIIVQETVDNNAYRNVCVGGLVGDAAHVAVANCYSTASVNCSSVNSHTAAMLYAGGMIGNIANATLTNSYATGDVSVSVKINARVSGLVGGFDSTIQTSGCFTTGNITARASKSETGNVQGGPLGYAYNNPFASSYYLEGVQFIIEWGNDDKSDLCPVQGIAAQKETIRSEVVSTWDAEVWNKTEGEWPTLK
ncbi:MAG: InlB B-repeat-containing protein [Clostridia bacterium]|nr:InlB B-repeat-containing protein [Clostridia bacterium]